MKPVNPSTPSRLPASCGGALLLLLCALSAPSAPIRVDLVPFGRVVRYEGDSPETFEGHTLERGRDGWQACKSADGEYMIGLMWDEPRDVAEISLDFRDAFPGRDRIRVQYFFKNWPNLDVGGWAPIDDPFHGQWKTVPLQNAWLGERAVTLPFASLNTEPQREMWHGERYRRTYHIRLLFGTNAPPPITALGAYGLQPAIEDEFELRLERGSTIRPPLEVSVVNGELLNARGEAVPALRLDAPLGKLRVRFLRVDVLTPTRTVVTIRVAANPLSGFSFLPQEVQSRGIITIPSLKATVSCIGANPVGSAALAPGMSVTDRVEREPEQTFARARREIPKLRKSRQRERPMYQPLGPPDARQEIAVNYDGSVLLHNSALKSGGTDSKRMNWPAQVWYLRLNTGEPPFDQSVEGSVKQRLLDGYLPILINSWETDGVRYEQTCVATFLGGEPAEIKGDETVVLLSRLVMTNTTSAAARAVVRLRTEPGEQLETDHGHVSATASRGEKVEPYPKPRYRCFICRDGSDAKTGVATTDSQATTVSSNWRLGPGEARSFEFRVPFVTIDTEAERRQIAALDFDHVLMAEAERWRKIISQAATFEVPDPLLTDFYRANLAHILITADRNPERLQAH